MPAVQPTLTYKSTPIPAVEVYLTDLQRKNLYPANTVPTSTTGWIVNYGTGGAGALSYPTTGGPTTAAAGYGRMTLSAIPTAGYVGAYRSQSASFMPVVEGLMYTHSMWIRTSVATVARPIIEYYNGTTILGGSVVSPDLAVPANTWTRISASGIAPATANRARFVGYTYASGWAGAPVGATYDFTGVLGEQEGVVNDYYAGTATPSTTPTNVTVYRLVDGETSVVRGANNAASSGAFIVNDFEAPFGKPVTYWAETFAGTTSQGVSTQNSITLNVNQVWIHDPLDITTAIAIELDGDNDATLGQGSFGSISRGYDYNRSNVIGKSRPVLQFYGERALESVNFDVLTKPAGGDQMRDLLQTAPVLIRVPGALGNLPRLMYGVLEASQEPLDWHTSTTSPLTRWSVVYNETEAQSTSVIVTFYSYAYWQSKYATYTAANSAYGSSTYINAVRNPPA